MSAIVLALLLACDPTANARTSTPAEKAQVRADVADTFERLGASPIIVELAVLIVWRESWGGEVNAVHTRGPREYGLGPMGLSAGANRDKWPGPAEELCDARVSAAVAHEVMWRAVSRWNAANAIGIQAIYARGRGTCGVELEGVLVPWRPPLAWRWSTRPWVVWLWRWARSRVECRPPPLRRTSGLCGRLAARGHSCRAPISERDLGRRFESAAARAAWVRSLR
jgi:hypothetical protein